MRKTINLLALGQERWVHEFGNALPRWQKNGFVGVEKFWDLCALPEPVEVDVAVVHHYFAQDDLRDAAEYIRRRWPDAMIVVIGKQTRHLDDPLYDVRASIEISPKELVWFVETSLKARSRNRRNLPLWLAGVRG